MLIFDRPTLADFEMARKTRNLDISGYRTRNPISQEEQERFFRLVMGSANDRFWAVKESKLPIALAGLEKIEWENGDAEASIVCEAARLKEVFIELLRKGFHELRLVHIYTQVYLCSPMLDFYMDAAHSLGGAVIDLPIGKYWNGQYYGSRLVVFGR